jgi:hypothetical protein
VSAALFIAGVGLVGSGCVTLFLTVLERVGNFRSCVWSRDHQKIRLACLSGQVRRMR